MSCSIDIKLSTICGCSDVADLQVDGIEMIRLMRRVSVVHVITIMYLVPLWESTKPSSPLALKCRSVQPMVVGVLWIPPVDVTDFLMMTTQHHLL